MSISKTEITKKIDSQINEYMAASMAKRAEFDGWSRQAYGMGEVEFLNSLKGHLSFTDPAMAVMQILSDAQEELARGNAETARQYMNKAKAICGSFLFRAA
jgi:hypothetical protein